MRGHLGWILTKLYRGDWQKMDESIKNILRVGLYQLKFSDRLPVFAVVDEAVKTAKLICPAGSGLVNAILRNYLRKADSIAFPSKEKNPAEYIAAVYSHPLWLVKYWIKLFGPKETEALCAANNEMPPLTLRVNTIKTSRNELSEKLVSAGFDVATTKFSPDGLIINTAAQPIQKTNFFVDGYLRLQDEASQLISWLVNPQSGETILDVCAGTGGKTTHLAAIQKNNGKIIATDNDASKLEELKKDAARLGISIIETQLVDLTLELPEALKEKFDHVLVDAPCSGLGTLRRNPEIKWRTTPADIKSFASNQATILQTASLAVKKGGRLIYSTCSLAPEENENIINNFLQKNPDFAPSLPPQSIHAGFIDNSGFFRSYPHLHNMDGFFGAILTRRSFD
jgi:16S rRNA (cytosine967-C5)-methyltransferase